MHLKEYLSKQAQNALANEVEIMGIPENCNENLQHVVLVTAAKIGIELKETDIDWVRRAGKKETLLKTVTYRTCPGLLLYDCCIETNEILNAFKHIVNTTISTNTKMVEFGRNIKP